MSSDALVAELRSLEASLRNEAPNTPDFDDTEDLAVIAQLLRKTGQQHLRASHAFQDAIGELKTAVGELRREVTAAQARARDDRLRLLDWLDAIDTAMILARQSGDTHVLRWFERVSERSLETLASLGLSEVPTVGHAFDERMHDVLNVVIDSSYPNETVIEVVKRGFWYDGQPLRRAQVVVAQREER